MKQIINIFIILINFWFNRIAKFL